MPDLYLEEKIADILGLKKIGEEYCLLDTGENGMAVSNISYNEKIAQLIKLFKTYGK